MNIDTKIDVKKIILSIFLVFVMLMGISPISAFAEDDNVAYVTIAVEGDLKLVHYPVNLSDVNNSGGYDIDDALYLAHNNEDADMEGGYKSYTSQYGLGVSKLWGDDSGWFGYTVNGNMATNLSNTVKAGDEVYAWVYTCKEVSETKADIEASFDKLTAETVAGEAVEVTLDSEAASNGADVAVHKLKDNYKPGSDEVETDAVFDANGKASVTINEAGTFVITAAAKADSAKALIPPYCVVTVTEASEPEVPSEPYIEFTVGDATAAPGEEFTVAVTVENELQYTEFVQMMYDLTNEGVTLVSVANGADLTGITASTTEIVNASSPIKWAMPDNGGELLLVTYKVNNDTVAGTYELGMDVSYLFEFESFNDHSGKAAVKAGTLTVAEASEPEVPSEPYIEFTVGDATAAPGEEFTVAVTVENELQYTEFVQMMYDLANEGVTLVNVANGADLSGITASTTEIVNASSPIKWAMPDNGGELLLVTYKVNDDTVAGTYELGMDVSYLFEFESFNDHSGKAAVKAGTLTVTEASEPEVPEEPEMPFIVTVGGEEMTEFALSEVTDPYNGVKPLYTVTIPEGTAEVTITWADGNNYTLSYYDANCSYFGFESQMKNSWTIAMDKNGDGAYDMLQIYDSGYGIPYWITFASEEAEEEPVTAPFTVTVGGEEMTEFALGEVTDPYNGVKPLYTVTIPEGTTEVTITWADGNNYTLSYYDANCSYFGFESQMKNSWTIAMDKNGDGAYDMLQIYDSGYGVPYWITFANAEAEEEPVTAPFTVTVGGEEMTEFALSEVNDPYNGTKPLYTVTIPEGTTEVTISWAEGTYTLSYYDANASYFGFESGFNSSWTVTMDKNGDGAYDMLQIYDSGYGVPYWITFVSEEAEEEPVTAPFTVTVGGEEMTEFTLGEVNDPYNGTRPLYTVTIPEGTTEVTITWAEGTYTLSAYDSALSYFDAYMGHSSSKDVQVDKNGDGAYDFLQVYDSGYGVPYWITFTSGTEEPDEPVASNVVALGNAEAWPGDLIELSIFAECVENDTNVFGRRFIPTLALPDGWTIVGAIAGEGLAGTVWELYETDLYGWVLNGTAENYYGAYLPNGELMKFQIQVAADAEAGEYTVELASAEMMKDDWSAGFTDFELVAGTVTVSIPEDKTKLDAPVLTEDSVFAPETYIEITVPASEVEPAAIVEYAISTNGGDWSEWQTDNKFTEVEDGTKYYVRARYNPHNDSWYEVSDASNVIEVTTKAFVDEPVIITLGDVSGGYGDTIYIPVSLSHSLDGLEFGTIRFCIEDNENLTLVGVAKGNAVSDAWSVNYDYAPHRAVSMYSPDLAEVPVGEIMILEYQLKEDAIPGTYELGLDQEIENVMFRYSVDGSGAYGTWIDYPVNIQVVESAVTIKTPLAAPVLSDYTATDDTVTVIAPTAVENAHIEYAISADGETYGEWQTYNVFAGLAEETTYHVIARYIADDGNEYVDSYASEPLEVKTVNPTAAYTLAEVTAKSGETVDVAVSLTHNVVKQAASFQIIPAAAEGLTLQDAKAGADLPEGWKIMLVDGIVTVYRTDVAAIPTGELVVLTYKVADDAEEGEYAVTLSESFTEDGNAFIAEDDSVLRVNGTVVAGGVTVMNKQYGDLDNDGTVDMKDLVSLRRYLAGWTDYNAEALNIDAIDLNADGELDMTDAIILNRHLAGWEDYKVLPVD